MLSLISNNLHGKINQINHNKEFVPSWIQNRKFVWYLGKQIDISIKFIEWKLLIAI